MKIQSIVPLLTVALIISFSAVGCKKRLQRTTPLPGAASSGMIGDGTGTEPLDLGEGLGTGGLGANELGTGFDPEGGIGQPPTSFDSWVPDRTTFATETVYFDFDKSNIRASEVGKLERVAEMMKTMPGKALRVEGHCDERGTEEYNRSLGERRALSAREYLVQLGLDPNFIETVSYGEDQPVDFGHTAESWAKNRRAEFILLSPP
jgi:peptidoglycan-associated lipoprotein